MREPRMNKRTKRNEKVLDVQVIVSGRLLTCYLDPSVITGGLSLVGN